jgi:catechol 2,3-dioxygenase-like lactoylglutathione lyase family enzyme
MADANSIFFYVADPSASVRFYSEALGKAPVESSPNFAMFVLDSGFGLGLWRRSDVTPAAAGPIGGSELGIKVKGAAGVDEKHGEWKARGTPIALPPTDLDFGRSFVALDPDGHRLRVYALNEEM